MEKYGCTVLPHLTDTLTLGDVWVQPTCCVPDRGPIAIVTMKQIVAAPHIKCRDVTTKMSSDDLLRLLYLNMKMQWALQGLTDTEYEEWINEKTAACVKVKGIDESSNRAKLCNYILTEDKDFTFYPAFLHNNFGIFFRKVCYHSYKTGKKDELKLLNPSMMKCCAARSKFEYVLEARVFMLPDNWFSSQLEKMEDDTEEVPESQV